MICSYAIFEGKEVFECFRDNDDLRRILMICVLESLQVKKALNLSGILMICGYESFVDENFLE